MFIDVLKVRKVYHNFIKNISEMIQKLGYM